MSPGGSAAEVFPAQARALRERVERFGFRKVRLFPGRSPSPEQTGETIRFIARRLRRLADELSETEFLLETHDGSLADDPSDVVRLLEECERSNVGLLWQPTRFEAPAARRQFARQRAHIRHVHLQNRAPDGGFVPLAQGVIPWGEFLAALPAGAGGTLEFVPGGICPAEQFDLVASLREAVRECAFVQGLTLEIPARSRVHLSEFAPLPPRRKAMAREPRDNAVTETAPRRTSSRRTPESTGGPPRSSEPQPSA